MGEQRNLTEENVDELKEHLERMQETNPELEYRFFIQEEEPKKEPPDVRTSLDEIRDDVDALYRKIDLIFGDHVLIQGRFTRIGDGQTEEKPIG